MFTSPCKKHNAAPRLVLSAVPSQLGAAVALKSLFQLTTFAVECVRLPRLKIFASGVFAAGKLPRHGTSHKPSRRHTLARCAPATCKQRVRFRPTGAAGSIAVLLDLCARAEHGFAGLTGCGICIRGGVILSCVLRLWRCKLCGEGGGHAFCTDRSDLSSVGQLPALLVVTACSGKHAWRCASTRSTTMTEPTSTRYEQHPGPTERLLCSRCRRVGWPPRYVH